MKKKLLIIPSKVNASVIGILVAVIGLQIILHFIGLPLILTIFYNACH